MAHESSNPKVKVMIIAAILSGVGLMAFDAVFRSYYTAMMEDEESEKVLTVAPKQLLELRAAEKQRLTSAALPIDRAMKELSTRGREDPGLKDVSKIDISPQPSNDQGALTGWGMLAKAVPAPAPAPSDHADGGAPTVHAGDGGAALATDAGAPHAAQLPEAGAPVPHPAPGGH